jgi:cell wall-associated NlpC family hydrolase
MNLLNDYSLLKKGDILEFKRAWGLYYHYAIYIGDNKVIHRDKQNKKGIFINNIYDLKGKMKILPKLLCYCIESK